MLKGTISIGKVSCSDQDNFISIRVEDKSSTINFLDIKMDMKDFADALMGLGHVSVEFELRGVDRVGKKYENKTLKIHVPYRDNDLGLSDDLIDRAVSEQEVDGWIGSRQDCKNHHNWVKNATSGAVYNVHFCRWVEEKIGVPFQKATAEWCDKHPGNKTFLCTYCGIYTAGKAKCNKCEEEKDDSFQC